MTSAHPYTPFPLSDYEVYALQDETPDYPMVMTFRFHLSGKVAPELLERSLTFALRRHPLLNSTVDESKNDWNWIQRPNATLSFELTEFQSAQPPCAVSAENINVRDTSGAKFELRMGTCSSVLICHLHHACVDGIGGLEFLADALARYGQLTENPGCEAPELKDLDPDSLTRRSDVPTFNRPNGEPAPFWEWLQRPLQFLRGRVYPICGHGRRACSEQPQMDTRVLTRRSYRRLKKLASAKGVSTNDLCMMAYFQQLAEWTSDDHGDRDTDLFRVLMPVSTRNPNHDRMSASNAVTYVFHDIHRRDCRNPEALLASIHDRAVQMINGNEGAIVLKIFRLFRRWPILHRMSKGFRSSSPSAVFANVGDLRRVFGTRFPLEAGRVVAGSLTVDRIDGIAPLRANTNVVVSVGTYAGELILNLRADPRKISNADAELFLQQFVDRLNYIAEHQTLIPAGDSTCMNHATEPAIAGT